MARLTLPLVGRDDKDSERDPAADDGMRPDEAEGPGASEASPARCEFRQGERTSDPSDAEFSATEELHESFPIEPIATTMGPDGLPIFSEPDPDDTQAVPFTYETQLCIEDDRTYVEIFAEELTAAGWTTETRGWLRRQTYWTSPAGHALRIAVRSRYDSLGKARARQQFSEWSFKAFGQPMVMVDGDSILVRPIRERCKHLKRQVFSNDSQPDPASEGHQIVFRVCAARRSNGGAYMSVSNEGIYACDFRDPPDRASAKLQDAKDKRKVVDRPDLLHLPLFNMPGDAVQLESKQSKQ